MKRQYGVGMVFRLSIMVAVLPLVMGCGATRPRNRMQRPAVGMARANHQPPPPRIPRNAPRLRTVRLQQLAAGQCLRGAVRTQRGTCAKQVRLPNMTKMLPWLKRAPASQAPGRQPPAAPPDARASSLPSTVTILVESALINGTKTDGRCWDAGCNQPQAKNAARAASALAVAVGGVPSPYAAAFNVLAPIGAQAMSPPDTIGWADVIVGTAFSEPIKLSKQQDSITPQWGAKFAGVPLTPQTRLRLQLWDADLVHNDGVGILTIGYQDIVAAMNAQETHQVPVGRQTHEQVLFVGISVLPGQ